MLGWGSWANTQKLAGKRAWPFPLYYFDYAIGVFVLVLILCFSAGSYGDDGPHVLTNLRQASGGAASRALLSGFLFNVSNVLLVVAIDCAGMAVAFPVGVGLALVVGTVTSYVATPKGNLTFLFLGVTLVVAAMIFSALAYHRMQRLKTGGIAGRGLVFALVAGSMMGLFYPQLNSAISPDFNTLSIRSGMLTPYTALLLFGLGVLISNLVVNSVLIRVAVLSYKSYFHAPLWLHLLGFAGGLIWMIALSCNVLASGVAGPAISYALGQGATLVAAIWGVFVWKEFRNGPPKTGKLILTMFGCYALGLILIGLATL